MQITIHHDIIVCFFKIDYWHKFLAVNSCSWPRRINSAARSGCPCVRVSLIDQPGCAWARDPGSQWKPSIPKYRNIPQQPAAAAAAAAAAVWIDHGVQDAPLAAGPPRGPAGLSALLRLLDLECGFPPERQNAAGAQQQYSPRRYR